MKVGFDINKFTEEFKNTIDWMLKDKYAREIKDDLEFPEELGMGKSPDTPSEKPLNLKTKADMEEAFAAYQLHLQQSLRIKGNFVY